jgi:hypothetical protein
LPGDQLLLHWEAALRQGVARELDIARVLTGAADDDEEREPADDDVVKAGDASTPLDEEGRFADDKSKPSD